MKKLVVILSIFAVFTTVSCIQVDEGEESNFTAINIAAIADGINKSVFTELIYEFYTIYDIDTTYKCERDTTIILPDSETKRTISTNGRLQNKGSIWTIDEEYRISGNKEASKNLQEKITFTCIDGKNWSYKYSRHDEIAWYNKGDFESSGTINMEIDYKGWPQWVVRGTGTWVEDEIKVEYKTADILSYLFYTKETNIDGSDTFSDLMTMGTLHVDIYKDGSNVGYCDASFRNEQRTVFETSLGAVKLAE